MIGKKKLKEVWIVFIRSIDVSHSQTLAISNDITCYKASIWIRENLVNLKIKIIIEKNTTAALLLLQQLKSAL